MRLKTSEQHADVEVCMVGNDAILADRLLNFRPLFAKLRFIADPVGRDPMDPDVRGTEDEGARTYPPAVRCDNLPVTDSNGGQLASAVRSPCGGFKIDRSKVHKSKLVETTQERTINHGRLSLPSLEIFPGYSRCAGPGEKYQKDSD